MSESSRVLLVLILVAGLGAPGGAAQGTAHLRERIGRLQQALDRRLAADARADSARQRQLPIDTVRAGALRVVTHRALTPLVTAAADSAWRALERTFGPTAARAGKGLIIVQSQAQPTIPNPPPTRLFREVTTPVRVDVGYVARFLVSYGSQYIGTERDSALTAWMRSEFIPSLSRDDRLEVVYVEMVTSPWSAARGCYEGDLADCRAALAISGRDDPIRNWYDAADRRAMVRGMVRYLFRDAAVMHQRCVRGGPDETCEATLRLLPASMIEPPLSRAAQFSLLNLALEIGGAGAYDRIAAEADRPIGSRLAAGAFLREDSLLSLWRGRVLAARPKTIAFGTHGSGAWAAVLWSVVLGVLALRSTRWR